MTLKECYEVSRAMLNIFTIKKENCMAHKIIIEIQKVSGGFTVSVGSESLTGTVENAKHGVATTPHQATVQARKLVKELLEQIAPTMGKETA